MQLFHQIGDGTNYGNAISWNLNLCEIVYLKICIVNNLKFNMMNKKILLKRDDTHLATIFHLRICWMLFLCVCVRYWLTCLYVHRRTYSQMARYLIINVRNKLEIMVYFWCAYLVFSLLNIDLNLLKIDPSQSFRLLIQLCCEYNYRLIRIIIKRLLNAI